jgi:hypothetical protein
MHWARYDAGLAYAKLTEKPLGRKAAYLPNLYVNFGPYIWDGARRTRRLRVVLVQMSPALVLAAVYISSDGISYPNIGASYHIILQLMQLIHHLFM